MVVLEVIAKACIPSLLAIAVSFTVPFTVLLTTPLTIP